MSKNIVNSLFIARILGKMYRNITISCVYKNPHAKTTGLYENRHYIMYRYIHNIDYFASVIKGSLLHSREYKIPQYFSFSTLTANFRECKEATSKISQFIILSCLIRSPHLPIVAPTWTSFVS